MVIASLAPVILLGLLAVGVLLVVVQKSQLHAARKRLSAKGFQVGSLYAGMGGCYVAVDETAERVALKGQRPGSKTVESMYNLTAVQSVTRAGDDRSRLTIVVMPKMGALHEFVVTMNDQHVATSVIEALGRHGAGPDDGWGVAYIEPSDE